MSDNIRHPAHYKGCSIECIEAMRIAFGTSAIYEFCKMNAFKYLWRHQLKNGKEDLKKAMRYIEMAEGLVVYHNDGQLEDIKSEVEKYILDDKQDGGCAE